MQLDFGDQVGPAGEYWRITMQEMGYDAPPHFPWDDPEWGKGDGLAVRRDDDDGGEPKAA
jgi:hypothetical protein